jgi:phosphopantetheine adenylyltransferase
MTNMSVNKRKCLSVHEKVEIVCELECGEKNVSVCKKTQLIIVYSFNFVEEQRANFICIREESQYEKRKMRKCGIDKALLGWFKVQRDAGFPINSPILKIQAEKFAM